MPSVQDYLTLTDIFFSDFKKWAQKNPEAVLFPFTGTQTVTPCEGAELSAPAFFLLSYAGNEMTSLSDGSSFGCFSSGCMALSTVPMSR